VRSPLVVHESTRILRLLELFRESQMHFAVIVDMDARRIDKLLIRRQAPG